MPIRTLSLRTLSLAALGLAASVGLSAKDKVAIRVNRPCKLYLDDTTQVGSVEVKRLGETPLTIGTLKKGSKIECTLSPEGQYLLDFTPESGKPYNLFLGIERSSARDGEPILQRYRFQVTGSGGSPKFKNLGWSAGRGFTMGNREPLVGSGAYNGKVAAPNFLVDIEYSE